MCGGGRRLLPRPWPRRGGRAARGEAGGRPTELGPGRGGAGFPRRRAPRVPRRWRGCPVPGRARAGHPSCAAPAPAAKGGRGSGRGKAARRREAGGAEAGAVGPRRGEGCRRASGNNQNSFGVSYSQVCAGRPGLEGSARRLAVPRDVKGGPQRSRAPSSLKTTGGKRGARPEGSGRAALGPAGPGLADGGTRASLRPPPRFAARMDVGGVWAGGRWDQPGQGDGSVFEAGAEQPLAGRAERQRAGRPSSSGPRDPLSRTASALKWFLALPSVASKRSRSPCRETLVFR